MGRTDAVASDPSVADYRATSPALPGRSMICVHSVWAIDQKVAVHQLVSTLDLSPWFSARRRRASRSTASTSEGMCEAIS